MSTVPDGNAHLDMLDLHGDMSKDVEGKAPTLKPEKPVRVNESGPKRRLEKRRERYRAAAFRACTERQFTAIFAKAVEEAIEGDKDARKFVAEYLVGKPKPVDHEQNKAPQVNIKEMQALLFNGSVPRMT